MSSRDETSVAKSRRRGIAPGLALLAVVIAAFNLRPSISAVGPVLESLQEFLGAGAVTAGILTAIPGIGFSICGLLAVRAGQRWGLTGSILLGAGALSVGLALRPWMTNPVAFLALSALAVAGIALANVLLPAWIKVHGGSSSVRLMTIYTCFLALGGGLGPATALIFGADDVAHARVEGSLADPAPWQWALLTWAFVAWIQVAVWIVVWRRARYDYPPAPPGLTRPVSLWRSRTAVALMVFFGIQSMNAYIQIGWLPTMFMDAAVAPSLATSAAMIVHLLGIVGGLLMPTAIARSTRLWVYTVGFAALTACGYGAMVLLEAQGAQSLPGVSAVVVAILLGVGGFCFPTAIALIPARTSDPAVTARLSGFVQPVGYILAAAGPLLVGLSVNVFQGWGPVLWVLVSLSLLMGAAGFYVARGDTVDHELARSSAPDEAE